MLVKHFIQGLAFKARNSNSIKVKKRGGGAGRGRTKNLKKIMNSSCDFVVLEGRLKSRALSSGAAFPRSR